jgi:hypothetical protein
MPTDPPAPTPPPLLRRPGFWITLGTVITLLVGGLYIAENIVGARKLARAKANLAAAGIELDPHQIPPTRPPDEENFFATPLLAAIGNGAASGPEINAARRIWKWELEQIGIDPEYRIEPVQSEKLTDWAAVRDAIAAKDQEAAITRTDNPIADLAASLERDLSPVFTELTTALTRPRSHQVPDFFDRLRAGADRVLSDHPGLNEIRALASGFGLRARLDIEAGNPGTVTESALILLKLAEGAEAEGSILAVLIGSSVRRIALTTAWAAANRRLLPRHAWLVWAQAFSQPRPLDRLPGAVQAEIHHAQHGIRHVRANSNRLIPRGWFDANEGHYIEGLGALHRHFQAARPPNYFSRASMDAWIRPQIEPNHLPWHRTMVRLALPVHFSVGSSAASSQAVSRLAQAACALEAYFLDHQTYPLALEAIVPAYLPVVPVDFDGQPIRYAPEQSNGRYKLWSIGEDGVDDGGVEKTNRISRTAKPHPWKEPVGDWVWQYAL